MVRRCRGRAGPGDLRRSHDRARGTRGIGGRPRGQGGDAGIFPVEAGRREGRGDVNVHKRFARMDWPLFLLALALSGVGLLNVYSGTRVYSSSGIPLFTKQMVWILLGMGVFFLFSFVGGGWIEEVAWHIFFTVVVLLLVVLLIGGGRGGAQRWLAVGFFTLPPS